MPNHVRNVLKFKNLKPDEVEFIVNTITIRMDVPTTEYMISFDKIIPEPRTEDECPEAYKVNKDSFGSAHPDKPWFDWYKWRIVHWDTKWCAYNGYTIKGKSYVTFVFNTAWSPPRPIIRRLCILGFDFEYKYADEDYGNNCGKMSYSYEHGLDEISETDMKYPVRFAENIWRRY